MGRLPLLLAAAALALPAAAPAIQEAEEEAASLIGNVLAASPLRDEDRARDQYRHPAETLAFFRVEPTMTVAEYAPGGGWYTRVIAPYVAGGGRYIAINPDSGEANRGDAWAGRFGANVQLWSGVFSTPETAFESDEAPDGIAGTIDRILIFRNIHSLLNGGVAESELANLHGLLADDGLVGVVQHRAPESETAERANGSRGYVKQSDVIALFERAGFELVEASEINANPADTADWEQGVWTLPPVLRLGDQDRERYLAIGESDRMTLLFRKAG